MKISYAITVCNELKEITHLLNLLIKKKRKQDEIVILFDKKNGTPEVWDRITELKDDGCCSYHAKTFKHHFADWKNQLTKLCSGDYIFQIDADEYPHDSLISQLPVILEANPENEVYLIPRVNTVKGLTEEHIQKWGWNVNDKGWVNWPDAQCRIYKNIETISWAKPVHEQLSGYKTVSKLPDAEEYSILHVKDIKRQERQNEFYSKNY